MAENPFRVVQTQGKGSANPELQHCPDDYHFELTQEQLFNGIQNPQSLAQSLTASGVPGLDRITSIVVSYQYAPAHPDTPLTPAGGMYCCRKCLTDSICCLPWPA